MDDEPRGLACDTCHGEWADLMKPVVAKLTDEDLVNIAAYVSSRPPK